MERSEWPDDDALDSGAYPPAPVPPHERSWRHPSEIGTQMWAHTEPPLTIGRGLVIATGAIGGLLSLVVLWAMLPSAGRGGVAEPTVVVTEAHDLSSPGVTARFDTFVATSVDLRLPPTTVQSAPLVTSVAQRATTTTIALPESTLLIPRTTAVETAPVAVDVGDSLVITTARAVEGRSSITVTGSDGQPHDAAVVAVNQDLGLAVLSADSAAVATSYIIGPAVIAGDVVTVRSAQPMSANVNVDADGQLSLDAWQPSMAEGTPVVNGDGQLVGMCSHGAKGPILVSVANAATLLQPPPTETTPPPPAPAPWLGLHVVDGAGGGVTIDSVDPNGPSAAAGIVDGDVVTAIDGVAVADGQQLQAAVAGHATNDVATLTITHADQTTSDVQVTVGAAPP